MNARTTGTCILFMSAWFIAACEQPAEISATPELKAGYWQAEITLPGAIIDTAFELSHEGDVWRAFLINGRERIPIDEVSYQNRELTLRFPAFNNHIKAKLAGGRLIGNLTLVRRYGETQTMPFTASPGSAVSSTDAATDGAATDLSGRWAVRFHNQDGTDSASIGEFAQRGSKLFGTFLNPNGDHRFLAGRVTGNRFKLSTFDGAHAFAFEGVVIDDTIERATFWSGTSWRQQWSASRNPDITLPDAFSRTFLKPGYERFEFEFPNLDGDPVSLDDEKFHGKVVIVTLAGTWCPNCNDEARFLAPFYLQYRDRGLEVVALMFEHFEDPETASRQIRNFRLKFDIQYETLLAGISDKDLAGDALPSLSAVLAWPTTIFIDRSSRVRTIHSGFAGPGTGEHYLRLQRKMTDIVTGLLNEPVDLLETLTQEAPTI